MEKLNVLYTVDHNYAKYMLVSLFSMLMNNKHLDITVHVICDQFYLSDYRNTMNVIEMFENSKIVFHHFSDIRKMIRKYNIPDWRGTPISNARLFFNQSIKDVDKILYLDSDTIVIDKLDDLNNYNQALNMVEDTMPIDHKKELSPDLDKYYNSGVLWINVDKWNKEDYDQRIIDTILSGIKYEFPDQDLLNITFNSDINMLPPEYNLFSTDAYYDPIALKRFYKTYNIERHSLEAIANAKKHPIILHCTPFHYWRPWNNTKGIHPYEDIYNQYSSILFGQPIKEESDVSACNRHIYKVINYTKLFTPITLKNEIKRLIKKDSN